MQPWIVADVGFGNRGLRKAIDRRFLSEHDANARRAEIADIVAGPGYRDELYSLHLVGNEARLRDGALGSFCSVISTLSLVRPLGWSISFRLVRSEARLPHRRTRLLLFRPAM